MYLSKSADSLEQKKMPIGRPSLCIVVLMYEVMKSPKNFFSYGFAPTVSVLGTAACIGL